MLAVSANLVELLHVQRLGRVVDRAKCSRIPLQPDGDIGLYLQTELRVVGASAQREKLRLEAAATSQQRTRCLRALNLSA